MHDVAYWREKAGIAGLFCGSNSDNPAAKANAGKIFNDILTETSLYFPRPGIDLICDLCTRRSTLVAGR
jgi:hypothetical protein